MKNGESEEGGIKYSHDLRKREGPSSQIMQRAVTFRGIPRTRGVLSFEKVDKAVLAALEYSIGLRR